MKKTLLLIFISLIVFISSCKKKSNPTGPENNLPAQGLVAYYPFNGNANDESGNDYNGTVYAATLTPDRFGADANAYNFPGTSDNYITTNYTGIAGSSERTIALWVKTTTNSRPIILSYGGVYNQINPGSTFICGVGRASNTLYASIDVQDGAISYKASTNDNTWHFYVWIVPNLSHPKCGDVKIYQDGVQLTTVLDYWSTLSYSQNQIVNTISGTSHTVKIGQFINSPYFSGQIDDIRIFNRALSNSEIQVLYHEGGWK